MSFAVERGSPTKAQLYLDSILDDLVAETGREEDRYCIAKVIFKCLRDNPGDIRQIDSTSGEMRTNKEMLDTSVRAALALQQSLSPGDRILIIGKNNLELSALYYGSIFAGIVMFPLHVGITVYELKHYIGLSNPLKVFTDIDHLSRVEQALMEVRSRSQIILLDEHSTGGHETFTEFIAGFPEHVQDFWPTETDRESTVLLLSTSGTTGLPKAVILTNNGLVSQLSTLWYEKGQFPNPTRIYFCTGNSHWMTYTIAMTTTPVYGVQILTASEIITAELFRTLLSKYRLTWSMVSPILAQSLVQQPGLHVDELSSLETLSLTGSAITDTLYNMLKQNVPPTTNIVSVYGLTEMHGCVVISKGGALGNTLGTPINITQFKIVDDEGNAVGPGKTGELCLKSQHCTFRGYMNNEKVFKESFTEDGWYKTGDNVFMNENDELIYVDRIKFMIKYQNYHVSPSEIEGVICGVEGVQMAAVCDASKGPAAVVVVTPGWVVDAQDIHNTVKALLSDPKRLRGGVAFVPAIPVSANGKICRNKVKDIFQEIHEDEIFYDV